VAGIDDWRLTLLLADAAQVYDGKLQVLGGGWQFIGPLISPYAVAILVSVPWTETNRRHKISIGLHDSDGAPIKVASDPNGADAAALVMFAEFEIGRPPGFSQGTPLNIPLAFSVGALPLKPGRYVWICTIDELPERDDWKLAFDVRGPG
jgi:hypothetical protein